MWRGLVQHSQVLSSWGARSNVALRVMSSAAGGSPGQGGSASPVGDVNEMPRVTSEAEAEAEAEAEVKPKTRKKRALKGKASPPAGKDGPAKEEKAPKKRKAGAKPPAVPKDFVFPRTELKRKPDPVNGLKVLSWNVNGLRAVLNKNKECLEGLVESEKPDVLFLQETKLQETHVEPLGEILPGYKSIFSSSTAKKGYSGTAMFIKEPLWPNGKDKIKLGINKEEHDSEGRSITLCLEHVNFVALYVPNSGMKLERLNYRTEKWDNDLREYIRALSQETGNPTITCGDFNVAHKDLDLYNPDAKHIPKTPGCTDPERNSFTKFLDEEGYIDSFRHLYPEAVGAYTYWSTRAGGRPFNRGLRLDYFAVPKSLFEPLTSSSPRVHDSFILHDQCVPASDHCPIGLTLELP